MYGKMYVFVWFTSPLSLNFIAVGGEYLLEHVKVTGEERCYFATAEDGKPCKLQRKPFSECFYTVAMAELSRATNEQKYQV